MGVLADACRSGITTRVIAAGHVEVSPNGLAVGICDVVFSFEDGEGWGCDLSEIEQEIEAVIKGSRAEVKRVSATSLYVAVTIGHNSIALILKIDPSEDEEDDDNECN